MDKFGLKTEIFDWLKDPRIIISALVCITSLIFVLQRWLKHKTGSRSINADNNVTDVKNYVCAFPNCIRCKKRDEIITRAKEKLKIFLKNLTGDLPNDWKQIETQLKKSKFRYLYELQKPNVFYLPSLEANPFWYSLQLNTECSREFMMETILKEFESVRDLKEGWKVNDTPNGKWSIFHLIDQGVETKFVRICKKTMRFVRKNKNLMSNTVFGNVAYSVLAPGTTIPAHYGPTNIRLRCHLGLEIPEGSKLTVGFDKEKWALSKSLFFDDSFLHSAENPDENKERCILMFDVWHPGIMTDPVTRKLLLDIFSPLT